MARICVGFSLCAPGAAGRALCLDHSAPAGPALLRLLVVRGAQLFAPDSWRGSLSRLAAAGPRRPAGGARVTESQAAEPAD